MKLASRPVLGMSGIMRAADIFIIICGTMRSVRKTT
jgi:hypothetical protein